jgi:hypothetical protein
MMGTAKELTMRDSAGMTPYYLTRDLDLSDVGYELVQRTTKPDSQFKIQVTHTFPSLPLPICLQERCNMEQNSTWNAQKNLILLVSGHPIIFFSRDFSRIFSCIEVYGFSFFPPSANGKLILFCNQPCPIEIHFATTCGVTC